MSKVTESSKETWPIKMMASIKAVNRGLITTPGATEASPVAPTPRPNTERDLGRATVGPDTDWKRSTNEWRTSRTCPLITSWDPPMSDSRARIGVRIQRPWWSNLTSWSSSRCRSQKRATLIPGTLSLRSNRVKRRWSGSRSRDLRTTKWTRWSTRRWTMAWRVSTPK